MCTYSYLWAESDGVDKGDWGEKVCISLRDYPDGKMHSQRYISFDAIIAEYYQHFQLFAAGIMF